MTTYDEIITRLRAADEQNRQINGTALAAPAVTAALASAPDEPSDDPDDIMDPRD